MYYRILLKGLAIYLFSCRGTMSDERQLDQNISEDQDDIYKLPHYESPPDQHLHDTVKVEKNPYKYIPHDSLHEHELVESSLELKPMSVGLQQQLAHTQPASSTAPAVIFNTEFKGKRKRKKTETCQACRFSRVRCENIGKFTKCKRCSRLGLKCLYRQEMPDSKTGLTAASPVSQGVFVSSRSSVAAGQMTGVKLGACEWCKIKKTKCENNPDGSTTCVLCAKKGRTCVRRQATRGRPLSGFTRRLLVSQDLSAPLIISDFPCLLTCAIQSHSHMNPDSGTRAFILTLEEFCSVYSKEVQENLSKMFPLLTALAINSSNTIQASLINEFALRLGISLSHSLAGLSGFVDASAAQENRSLKRLLGVPEDPAAACIELSVRNGQKYIQANGKFIELFCENKHVNGQPINTLARNWKDIISFSLLQEVLQTGLKHYLTQSHSRSIESKEGNSYVWIGQYIHSRKIEICDKNMDIITCLPLIKYEIQNNGNVYRIAFIIKEICRSQKNKMNLNVKQELMPAGSSFIDQTFKRPKS